MRKLNVWVVVGTVFAVAGLILLAVATGLTVSSARFAGTAAHAEGTVVGFDYSRGDRSHGDRSAAYPYVTYVGPADRREYTFRDATGSNPPSYAVGERVPVLYDPARPTHARIDSFANRWLGPLICGGLGAVFAPLGSVFLLIARRNAKRARWLRSQGRERWASVDHIGRDLSVRVNGECPFVVHASWLDERTGRSHTATSEHLWHDPGPGLLGRQVRVLFDPADPDRNLIDLQRSSPGRH